MIKTCVSSYGFGYYNNESQLGVLGVVEKAAQMGRAAERYQRLQFVTIVMIP